ncbi:MAG: glycosyltransferase family 4 protein [Candidatus Omnitrophota bacterium]
MGYIDVSGMERKVDVKKIKVLQVVNVGFTVKNMILPLIDRALSEGYDVAVACAPGEYVEDLKTAGYKITTVEMSRTIDAFSNIKTVLQLYRFMEKEKFDIVHTHGPVTGILARVSAKLAKVPIVIYTAHGFYFHENMSLLKKKFFIFIEKIAGRFFSDMILTQSAEDKKTAIDEGIIGKDSIECISNGVKIQKFSNLDKNSDLFQEFGLSEQDKILGFTGRLTKEKGIFELVEALKILKETFSGIKLLVIGGTLKSEREKSTGAELKEFIKECGVENEVVFTGFRNDIPELMVLIDVFVLPSHREGMPRSIIEAMVSAKPVVATNIRGCREEVVHGVTGLLVPVKDSGKLGFAIKAILADKNLAEKMGQAGRERALKEFDEKLVLDREMSVYKKLIEQVRR